MKSELKKQDTFKICITMAGAVSAGAYTAGVMDYLFETLQLWEEAKEYNRALINRFPDNYLEHADYKHDVPMHDVSIEVIGGASAGGITGTLSMLSLGNGTCFGRGSKGNWENNLLYSSWVDIVDDKEGTTLAKLMKIDDLEENDGVESLLNSMPLEKVADMAVKGFEFKGYPAFVASDLDLILTVSNLRGLNYLINFEARGHVAKNHIVNHGGFLRFRMGNGLGVDNTSLDEQALYTLNLGGQKRRSGGLSFDEELLKEASLATGAFPIGLKPRELLIDEKTINKYAAAQFVGVNGIEPEVIKGNYRFAAVDGGMINNEPFGRCLKVLKEKRTKKNLEENKTNFATILIDPFPSKKEVSEPNPEKIIKRDIISIALNCLGALRNQVLFTQDGLIDALNSDLYTRFLIAPTRKALFGKDEDGVDIWSPVNNPIACGALGGFSGFFSRSFREHDFQLGRQNCQSFLRYYFVVPATEIDERFNTSMSDLAIERYSIAKPRPEEGVVWKNVKFEDLHVPIIPDMRVLNAFNNVYDTNKWELDAKIKNPIFPQINWGNTNEIYSDQINARIKKLRKTLVSQLLPKANGFRTRVKASLANAVGYFWGDGALSNNVMESIKDSLKEGDLLNDR